MTRQQALARRPVSACLAAAALFGAVAAPRQRADEAPPPDVVAFAMHSSWQYLPRREATDAIGARLKELAARSNLSADESFALGVALRLGLPGYLHADPDRSERLLKQAAERGYLAARAWQVFYSAGFRKTLVSFTEMQAYHESVQRGVEADDPFSLACAAYLCFACPLSDRGPVTGHKLLERAMQKHPVLASDTYIFVKLKMPHVSLPMPFGELLETAAGRGSALANAVLGSQALNSGQTEEAIRRYSRATTLGLCEAALWLANLHMRGVAGYLHDPEAAFRYFRTASYGPQAEARVGLSQCYFFGVGTRADSEAGRAALEAAARSDPQAKESLAVLRYLGRHMEQDRPLALRLLREAAAEGSASADALLACIESADALRSWKSDAAHAAARSDGLGAAPTDAPPTSEPRFDRDRACKELELHFKQQAPRPTAALIANLERWVGTHPKDTEATSLLGECYSRGVPLVWHRDLGRARGLFAAAAELGHVQSIFLLALTYSQLGGDRNSALATEWYRKAVQAGDVRAYAGLAGQLLEQGNEADRVEAMGLLERGLAAKDPGAMNVSATQLMHESSDETNMARVINMLRSSASRANLSAQFALGVILASYTGKADDREEGLKWLDRAAWSGLTGAMRQVIRELRKTQDKDPAQQQRLFEHYRLADWAGDADGQLRLVAAYLRGEGTEKNVGAAIETLIKASERGNGRATCIWGILLELGILAPASDRSAARLFDKAYGQGDIYAPCY